MALAAKIFGCLFACLLLVSMQPAYAEERSFQIDEAAIHARIDSAGDMQVEERDTYRFDGAFNGIIVDLNSAYSDGIEHFQAFKVAGAENVPLRAELTGDGDKLTYKVYDPSENESKVFRFTYTVKNVVQVYADTAELYWKFFDETNPSPLETVNIEIELPDGVAPGEIEAFGHGPSQGNVEVDSTGIVRYRVSPLPSGELLEARILFPGAYVPGSTRISADDRLAAIREEEGNGVAGQDDDGIETVYGAAALLIANLIAGIYVKFGRTFRPEWQGRYCPKLPENVTPAVVGYLMKYRVKPRDLIATLVDLVHKRYVDMQMIDKGGGQRKQINYAFRLLDRDAGELQPHETLLIDWFFGEIGRAGTVTLAGIRKYAKGHASAFRERWSQWQAEVGQTARQIGYVEDQKWLTRGVLIAVAAQFFGLWFLAPSAWKWLMICSLPLLFFIPKSKRRTRAGQTAYAKWKAFKRFLHDHKRMESQELPAVHAWGHYFVYAIPLGEAKQAAALIQLHMPSTSGDDYFFYDNTFYYHYEVWTESFEKTIVTMYQSEASSSDSGGSFSSGGGGGGGGGGRDAF